MFGHRRGGRAAHSPTPVPAQAAGHAVRDAEQFVRGAWERELLRQRDHMQFALHAAYQDRDTAYACVAEAQRDGDPRKIAAAHAALETALDTARRSAAACDQLRRTLRAERDLLGWAPRSAWSHPVPANQGTSGRRSPPSPRRRRMRRAGNRGPASRCGGARVASASGCATCARAGSWV
jgi:hypothetical protein